MANQKKIIEIKNVGVTYKEHKSLFKSEKYQALKDVSFDVYKGEILGVIGRNGAGKSTLLRLLTGIIKPNEGEVIHHTKSVALMALAAGFDSNLSGRQNTIINGMLIGYSKKEILLKIEKIKIFSELQDFYEKPVKNYSSGMRARLAFSITIYMSPDVLLIDEVLSVGDISFRQKAEQALEEKISSDITVILVSHSEALVSRLAERIVWIDGGKIRKQGLPSEIFPEYNINVRFSTFGLKVKSFYVHSDYIVIIEPLTIKKNKLMFNAIILNKNGKELNKITYLDCDKNINKITKVSPTPGLAQKYPKNNNANNARFCGFELTIGEAFQANCFVNDAIFFLHLT
ncbi:ATP-binding cassette domain-containing protein [Aliivibrio fischeri]|uniref:ABC transporter ATP-binding protein n=1 Tax=Aliivibrio fischeri TaxID=668 RepID=UPI0012DA2ABC|nr:ABC transporter ATP-binding protein [Aliivibrio fischeri]MUJ28016.1 ATP-binding cassette domain-containing protein [Aliivibrio fischeri]